MRINLQKLMQDRDLDKGELATVLFPTNLHPSAALSRILQGRARLKEEQIYRLSIYTGLSIDSLYADLLYWKTQQQDDVVRFSRDNYTAIYSPATGITKIYHLESLLATQVLGAPNQLLSEYFQQIDEIIINKSVSI